MKTNKLFAIAFLTAIAMPSMAFADDSKSTEKTDTVAANSKEVENRNVMLNASSDNQPRQISIGLPSSLSATIYEDGLPVSYNVWPCLPYLYWTGTAGHGRMGLLSLGESALTSGAVNYAVMSETREGGDKFETHINYTTNIYNLQRYDLAVAGPIAKGLSFSASIYGNLDPGSNNLADVQYATDMKILKAGLTYRWNENKGKASLFYRYAYTKSVTDSYGPFIYNGDGSVSEYNGFRLGKDGFLPQNGNITYLDIMTGDTKTTNRGDGTHALNNALTFNFDYEFDNGMQLDIRSKYNYSNAYYTTLALSGVQDVTASDGYTYGYDYNGHTAGEAYEGKIATRYLLRDIGFSRDWLTTAELKRKVNNHSWRLGFNFFWDRQGIQANTGVYAHTIEADPAWLYKDGVQGQYLNTGAEYYNSHETKTALYASDDWQITDRFFVGAGVRLEYYELGGKASLAYSDNAGTNLIASNNIRTSNWTLTNGTVNTFSHKWFNPSATVNARWTLFQGFGLVGEYVFATQHPNSQDFAGAYYPITDAVNIHLGRAGIFYNNSWMKLVSQVSIISQSNYKSRTQFTNPTNAADVATLPITYDVQTMGWTTDVVLTPFKGFQFHGLLTLQSPKYKNFIIHPGFASDPDATYDFSDKTTTGVSKTIIELDPSYSFGKFRVWASFRYQSKQYINKTNSLYFNGRWETFAGIDYNYNEHLGVSVNFINLLNQKGADGSISATDLLDADDAQKYNNYVMTGTYIRPFTVEFAAHINF